MTLAERFEAKVIPEPNTGCWIWTGAQHNGGYGCFNIGNHRNVQAHRFAWRLAGYALADDKFLCHKCDNPWCVNPAHLFVGTNNDNMADMKRKGRRKGINNGERHGRAKLTRDDVLEIRRLHGVGIGDRNLAKRYHVSMGNIWNIHSGKNWRHV